MPQTADGQEPGANKPDLLSSTTQQLEQRAWEQGKQDTGSDFKKARGSGQKAYTDKAAGNNAGYDRLMSPLYENYAQRFPRFANVEPPPENEVMAAKLKPPTEKDAQLAKMRSDLETRLKGRAELYAQATGLFDATATAHDFEAMEAVLTALPTMAGDKDVAAKVVNTVKIVDGEKGTAGLIPSLDHLRRMTVHYSGISREQPDLADELRQRIAPAEGYAVSRQVSAILAKESSFSLTGGKLSPKDWGETLAPVFGEQSAIIRHVELNYNKVAGQPTEPEFVGNALLMALNNPELVRQISPQETDKLKLAILGCAEYALDNPGEGDAIGRRVTKSASLVYEVCGDKTLAEATTGNGVLAEQLKKVADRAGEALQAVDPKITAPSGTEALAQAFADKEAAKVEKAQAAIEAAAAERRQQEEALAIAAKRAEEERTKAAIEKAAADLKGDLDPGNLWAEKKNIFGKGQGKYSPTILWNEQFAKTSKSINALRGFPELTPDQQIQLAALEKHSNWLAEETKPKPPVIK